MMAETATAPPALLDHALAYLARGWPIFPICRPHGEGRCEQHGRCANAGKRPLVRWEAYQSRIPAESEVRSWWRKWPRANIGMATGGTAGIVVLDADGSDARKEALQSGGLDTTPAVWTGKPGGAHYHLQHPGYPVRNFARRLPGLDFRGDGGYVLLPPSRHAQGADYRWVEGTAQLRPAEVPAWLHDLLRAGPSSSPSSSESDHTPLDPAGLLAGIPEGARDDTLYRWACKLRNDDVPQGYAELLLRQAARLCRPPFDEAIAVEKIQRAYRAFTPTPRLDAWPGDTDDDGDLFNDADAAREPWQVYDAATFLARELPVAEWRVASFVRDQAIVWTFGAPGTIKTYIATDAALAIATGGLFLEQFVTHQGKVLIIQEDTLEADYQQVYLRPLIAARGVDPASLADWLFIAPQAGMRLDDGERLRELIAWLEANRPALVVLDAFYLLHAGEGYGKEMRRLVNVLRQLRSRMGTCIWIIDHDRKGGEGRDKDNPIDRLIGGREKSGGCDAVIEVLPVKGTPGVVEFVTHKLRGGRPHDPLTITMAAGRLSADSAKPEAPMGAADAVYGWLRLEGGSRTKKQIGTGCDLSERSVGYALSELFRRGVVRKAGKVGSADTWLALSEPEVSGW